MKQTYELIAPCHFGLEAVLKKEILDLGYEIASVEDGRVTFIGDDEAICRANVFLRTAERILLKAGSFKAETFEELFQGTRAIAWEELIPEDGKFWVAKASSIKSKLFSLSQGQRPGRALSHTGSAVYTEPSCFGIMTIFAVNVAALEENGSSVSRTVYTAERNDSIYNGFHQRTFLSRI